MATLAANLNVPNTGSFIVTPTSLPCHGASEVVVFVESDLAVNMLGQVSENGTSWHQVGTNSGGNKSKVSLHAAGRSATVFHVGGSSYFRVFFYQSGAGPATVNAQAYRTD